MVMMMMMMMASPLAALSPDTRNHVLEYLPLRDCLRYSQVSRQGLLRDILPHLKRRRARQFLFRHAYQLSEPSRVVPVREIPTLSMSSSSRTIDTEKNVDVLLQPINGDKNQWHVLPSIVERIQALYRALPMSHPSNDDVRWLLLDLQQEDLQLISEQGISTNNFQACLQELQSVSKAHRIHERLLANSTVACHPPLADRGFAANAPLSVTTTLENYIGDVLIAYFLMAHSVAGIVEGKTNHYTWTQDLIDPLHKDEGPVHWYRRWVFLHSTLLRTFPMTRQQLALYKLVSPLHGILGRTEPQNVEYIHPHYCFLATGTSVVDEITRVVSDLVSLQNERRLVERSDEGQREQRETFVIETRYHQFGPLGPAFRGRDRVQTDVMIPPMILLRFQSPHFAISPTWQLLEEGRHFIANNERFHIWFTIPPWITSSRTLDEEEPGFHPDPAPDAVSGWMMVLANECYKNRPMTVEHPLVTISNEYLG